MCIIFRSSAQQALSPSYIVQSTPRTTPFFWDFGRAWFLPWTTSFHDYLRTLLAPPPLLILLALQQQFHSFFPLQFLVDALPNSFVHRPVCVFDIYLYLRFFSERIEHLCTQTQHRVFGYLLVCPAAGLSRIDCLHYDSTRTSRAPHSFHSQQKNPCKSNLACKDK